VQFLGRPRPSAGTADVAEDESELPI